MALETKTKRNFRIEALEMRIEQLQSELEFEKSREDNSHQFAFRRLDNGELDDTVITGATGVHLELMDESTLWIGIYLEDDERVCFYVKGMTPKGNHGKVQYDVTELPDNWTDWDKLPAKDRRHV